MVEELDQESFFTSVKTEDAQSGPFEDVVLYTGNNKEKICSLGAETIGCVLLDCGSTANVCGKVWADSYMAALSMEDKKLVEESVMRSDMKRLRFGGDEVLDSVKMMKIPAIVGGKKIMIKTHVVLSKIPLLWSRPGMKKAGLVLDLQKDRVLIFGKWQELQTTSVGHYALYIVPMEDKPENCLPFFMPVEKEEKKAVILKLHRQFGHPGREVLENLLKKVALWDKGLSEILTQIYGQCKTCRLVSQTQPRPVVSLFPASKFGEALTLDLKEIKQDGRTEGCVSSAGLASPLGPDSTWEESAQVTKMDARFAALEQKLLKDQEEKFLAIMAILKEPKTEEPKGLASLRSLVEDRLLPAVEKIEAGKVQETNEKLDSLMQGEGEANKLIDLIATSAEKVQRAVDRVHDKVRKETESLARSAKDLKNDVYEMKRSQKDLTDMVKRNSRLLEKMEEKVVKVVKAGNRRHHTGDSDTSRSGSRRRSRSETSRRSKSRSASEMKGRSGSMMTTVALEQEVTRLLEQINGSLEKQREALDRHNAVTVLEAQGLPFLSALTKALKCQATDPRLPAVSKWETRGSGDRWPSRVKKRVQGKEDKETAKKKRRKARSCSSSSSSNSSEEGAGKAAKSSKMKVDNSYEKMLDITVSAVKNGEEKVKELSKNTKKSQQKVETDCQIVHDMVGEMTIAVQVILENLDSVNDVGKKIKVLDEVLEGNLDHIVQELGQTLEGRYLFDYKRNKYI